MKKKLLTALLCISLVGQGIMVSAADFTSGNQESVETSRTAQGENNLISRMMCRLISQMKILRMERLCRNLRILRLTWSCGEPDC